MGISLGLVGLGSFGSAFAKLFKSHPLVDRFALCDREPERLARFTKDPFFADKFDPSDAYASLDDICASDLDALAIITQHWLHTPQAVQALEAGKHVYSAVPLLSVPDGDEILEWCDKLIETVRRTGLHYMYGETTYCRPQAMYCRRQAAAGAFGEFIHAEGDYLHDVEHGLREVKARREGSASGQEWVKKAATYKARGIVGGPMHYPTHSTAGPICVMNAHAVRVCAWPFYNKDNDPWFEGAPSDETALFQMSNGATMRICEHREIGMPGRETFRVYGSQGSFEDGRFYTKHDHTDLTAEEMRDPLPPSVAAAFRGWKKQSVPDASQLSAQELEDFLGGHGGSHAYLVHEFVDAVANDRMPAITAWDAVRYTAAGVMAHQSALKDGEVLDVPDWGDAPE